MENLRYYSPVRFIYGSLVVLNSLLKTFRAKISFPVDKKPFGQLDRDCFIEQSAMIDEQNEKNINTVTKAFLNVSNLKSVVNNAFVDWVSESNTQYLMPDQETKKALVDILNHSKFISQLNAHHGFEFYCKAAAIFRTQESESKGTTSINFHRDGHPPFTYKLMVYLTNVAEKSGAFAFKPNSNAKIIIPRFGSYNYKRGFEAENYKKLSLYGDAGHTILFKNNALHAGGRTTEGERIVVTFLLHPRYLSSQDNSITAIDWTVGAKEYSLF